MGNGGTDFFLISMRSSGHRLRDPSGWETSDDQPREERTHHETLQSPRFNRPNPFDRQDPSRRVIVKPSALFTITIAACFALLSVPATAETSEPEPIADLNGDGVVNVFDLLILLENWG